MANAITEVREVQFIIEPDFTICNLFYTSTEPGTPWGGGWVNKQFPKTVNAVEILQNEVPHYIDWDTGRKLISSL